MDAATTRWTPSSRHSSSRLNVPTTLLSKLFAGFSMLSMTRVSAARCTTASWPSSAARSSSPFRRSPAMIRTLSRSRCFRSPRDSLSITVTAIPWSVRWVARWRPMNPAPPVIRTCFMGCFLSVRAGNAGHPSGEAVPHEVHTWPRRERTRESRASAAGPGSSRAGGSTPAPSARTPSRARQRVPCRRRLLAEVRRTGPHPVLMSAEGQWQSSEPSPESAAPAARMARGSAAAGTQSQRLAPAGQPVGGRSGSAPRPGRD